MRLQLVHLQSDSFRNVYKHTYERKRLTKTNAHTHTLNSLFPRNSMLVILSGKNLCYGPLTRAYDGFGYFSVEFVEP